MEETAGARETPSLPRSRLQHLEPAKKTDSSWAVRKITVSFLYKSLNSVPAKSCGF